MDTITKDKRKKQKKRNRKKRTLLRRRLEEETRTIENIQQEETFEPIYEMEIDELEDQEELFNEQIETELPEETAVPMIPKTLASGPTIHIRSQFETEQELSYESKKTTKKQTFVQMVKDTEYVVYRITPHRTNLNRQTRDFQKIIFDILGKKERLYKRVSVKILDFISGKSKKVHVVVKENPSYWWSVRMYVVTHPPQKDEEEPFEEQRIEFYVAVPYALRNVFRTKFQNFKDWRQASIDEVDNPFEKLTTEDTDLYSLKYARNDMFSLRCNYKEQMTPVNDILAVSRDLSEGEEVNVIIRSTPIARSKWKQLGDYAWSVWENGGVPAKTGFDKNMIMSETIGIASMLVEEVRNVLEDILASVHNTFYFDAKKQSERKPILKRKNPERDKILLNNDDGRLSQETVKKRNLAVFETDIFCTVKSKDPEKRDMLARAIPTAMNALAQDNYLEPVKINIKPRKALEDLYRLQYKGAKPNMMSTSELGKLQQLPTAEMQRDYLDIMEANDQVEVALDKELTDTTGILIGTASLQGKPVPIHIQQKHKDIACTPRILLGSPRMGKDQQAINYVVEGKLKHNMGAVILEVINEQATDKGGNKRGMGDAIRDHIPASEVIDIDFLNEEHAIYLGFGTLVQGMKNSRLTNDFLAEEMVKFLLVDGDENLLRTVEYLKEAAKITKGDIMGIQNIFTSPTYREQVIEQMGEKYDAFIWEEYELLSDKQQSAIYTPILRRIGQITSSEFLRPIFCQKSSNKFDFAQSIQDGKIIIFRMKKGVISQRAIELLTYWIILLTYFIKIRAKEDGSIPTSTNLILNEPFQYFTKNLADLLTHSIFPEGPKYRLTPIFIFHNFAQFNKHKAFIETLKSSSVNWHLFRNTNIDVYADLFPYLVDTFEDPQAAFEATDKFEYIGVFLNSEGGYYPPFVAKSLPLVGDRYESYDNEFLTKTGAEMYGTNVEEILEQIREERNALRRADRELLKEQEAQEK